MTKPFITRPDLDQVVLETTAAHIPTHEVIWNQTKPRPLIGAGWILESGTVSG